MNSNYSLHTEIALFDASTTNARNISYVMKQEKLFSGHVSYQGLKKP